MGTLKRENNGDYAAIDDQDDRDWLAVIHNNEPDLVLNIDVPVVKHLQGKHDQKEHAGEGARLSSGKVADKTNWVTRKAQLKRQLSGLISNTTTPKDLKKRLQDALKSLDTVSGAGDEPFTSKELKQANAIMRNINALTNEAKWQLPKFKSPKVEKPKVTEAKKSPATQTSSAKVTTPAAPPKPKPEAQKNPKSFFQRAKDWINNVIDIADNKAIELNNAAIDWIENKLTGAPKQSQESTRVAPATRQVKIKQVYDDWNNKQIRANNMLKQVKNEYARTPKGGIPTFRFYQLANQYLDVQKQADVSRDAFKAIVGVSGSFIKSDYELLPLESAYA